MTEPTTEPVAPEPAGAVVEIMERRRPGYERLPETGNDSIVRPNTLRINGVPLWATVTNPVIVHQIVLDGQCVAPFLVTVTLQARSLRIGEQPTYEAPAEDTPGRPGGAIVEIPDVDGVLEPGQTVQRPYVLLNGKPVFIAGGSIGIGEMTPEIIDVGGGAVRVTLTLSCRRLIVDDELIDDPTT